jgi:hypothetical protein
VSERYCGDNVFRAENLHTSWAVARETLPERSLMLKNCAESLNKFMLGILQHFLRAYDESQIRLKSPFDGKIDGSCVPGPGGSSLRPDHLTNDSNEAAKEIPRSESHARLHAPGRG